MYLNINKNKLKGSCVERNGSGVHRNFVEIVVTSITITVGVESSVMVAVVPMEITHRAQVHIRGYGSVHTGGAEFEARKRRKVDLISFEVVIKIKVSNLNVPSNISSYCYSFQTS